MKKLFITGVVLCSAIILLGAQTGFAYVKVSPGCIAEGCHSATQVHGVAAHGYPTSACTLCHDPAAGAGTAASAKCADCHTPSATNACPLIETPHGNPSVCLGCHVECAPASTTTTTAEGTTTTTAEGTTTTTAEGTTTTTAEGTTTTTAEGTTTTTVPSEDCITIAPNSVTVSGADVTQDVVVTFTRDDITEVTQEQLDKLEITTGDACLQYITLNSREVSQDQKSAKLNITVDGTAPQTNCFIQIADPQGAFNPPLNCTATFTIFAQSQCSVTVEKTLLELKAGVLPKVRRIRIIGENSNFKLFQSKVTIEDIPIVIPLLVTQGIRINAWIVIPSTRTGFEPGTKQVKVETGTETCFGTVVISE